MFLIKFFIYFSLSFLILNIPMGGSPIFYSLEKLAAPLTSKVFHFMKETSKDGLSETKKLFSNTVPPVSKKDEVKETKSSTIKPLGKYTPEEKEFLKSILKKAQE